MASQKSYLEFSPPGNPGQLFPGSNVPVDVRHTPSRREHLRAYFAFMRPEVTHLMNRYGQLATENICKALYESGKRAVPSQGFELMVDRSMWRLWFQKFGSDGPVWPWGEVLSTDLADGETPNRIFAQYCDQQRLKEARMTIQAVPASVPSTSSNTDPKPHNEFIIYSKAVFLGPFDERPIDNDFEKRKQYWESLVDPGYHSRVPHVVGPFEAETPSSLAVEEFICKYLAATNELLPKGVIIKFNATSKCVIVTVGEATKTDGNDDDVGKELLRVWKMVENWLTLIGQHKPVTLFEHLTEVLGA
ncbi:hypothetical protein ACHAPJ_010087 [Fusarium lateritium]